MNSVLFSRLATAVALMATASSWAQAPAFQWTRNIGAAVFAVDRQTNVYATANGAVIILTAAGVPVQTNAICPLPGLAQRDAAGNYIFAGTFDGTQDFGGITLVGGWTNAPGNPPGTWIRGYPTCFLAKYTSGGGLQWVVSFGPQGNSGTQVTDLALGDDGSAYVGVEGSYVNMNALIARYTDPGTNLWTTAVDNEFDTAVRVRLGHFTSSGGCFLLDKLESGSPDIVIGGFVTAAGAAATYPDFYPALWLNAASRAGKPVAGPNNTVYMATSGGPTYFNPHPPLLWEVAPDGSSPWSELLGSNELFILAGDSQTNLYLSGADGTFSKYDLNGNFLWTTNLGLPSTGMVIDSNDNRFVQLSDGTIGRLLSDPPAVEPGIFPDPASQTVFVGDSVVFSPGVAGTPPLHYQWYLGGTNIPGATSATFNLVSAVPTNSGLYTLVVTNIAGAVTSNPALLRVKSVEWYLGSQLLTNGTYTFSNAPTLAVHSAFTNGAIYYTLDGSAPDFTGNFYTKPITITQNATAQAIGYSADFSQSEQADPVNVVLLVTHTLTSSSPGGGTVGLNPPGGTYLSTQTVTATANPNPGWQFLYWMGDASGTTNPLTVTTERDKSVVAVFGTELTNTIVGNGQVQFYPQGGLYSYGQVVRLTGVPQSGSFFGSWGNAASGNTNPLYFAVTAPTQTVSSIFGTLAGNQAALTILINGHGQVSANPRANVYPTNTSVTLTAIPGPGGSFLNWSGDANGVQNPLGIVMDQSKVITANFSGNSTLRVNRSEGDGYGPAGFRFTLVGDPGSVSQIYVSSNLTTWTSLGYVTNETGQFQFTDPASVSAAPGYYKVAP